MMLTPCMSTENGSLFGFRCLERSRKNASPHACKEGTDVHTTVNLGVPMATWHTFRVDGYGKTASRRLSATQAIRQQCRECYGFCENVAQEISDCPSEMCALYPFRFGKDPGKRMSAKQVENARNLASVRRRRGVESGNIETSQEKGP